jgi:hypothetical protein
MISLYCPKGDIADQFVCRETYVEGVSGWCPQYTQAYVELVYMLYRLFGWGMRQMTGYL